MEYTPKIPKFTTHNQLDLGTLWISTDYAQKNPPQTLHVIKKICGFVVLWAGT